jgi:hypothetical protein
MVRSRKSSEPFRAQYGGFCGRCGRVVETGQMIQCHSDYYGVVHVGCDGPQVVARASKAVARPPTRGAGAAAVRRPPLCPDCHLEHAAECW